MARMMDSLILDNISPFTYTKITTTHRPLKTSVGLKKTTSTSTPSIPQTANIIRPNNQKSKIPIQGLCLNEKKIILLPNVKVKLYFPGISFIPTVLQVTFNIKFSFNSVNWIILKICLMYFGENQNYYLNSTH